MLPTAARKRSRAWLVREAILEASPRTAGLIGLAAGILSAATAAVVIEVFYFFVGLVAPSSTIEGLGSARFLRDGERLGLAESLSAGVRGGLTLIADLWPALVALSVSGFILANAFHRVGQARSSWSFAGALLSIFGVCTAGISIWAFLKLLTVSSQLADRDAWREITFSDRIWTSDVGLVVVTLLIATPISLILLALWRWWVLRIARVFVSITEPAEADGSEVVAADEPISYIQYQQNVRRLKIDSAELRALDRDWRRAPDPVLEQTVVVDRDRGRAVPPWMEPMAGLNTVIGKPLLAVFAISLTLWLAASLIRDRQGWEPQRGEFGLSSSAPLALSLEITDFTRSLRIFGLSGRATIEIRLHPPGNEEAIEITDRLIVDLIDPARANVSGSRPLSYDFEGSPPGVYRLAVTMVSGEFARLGYSLGFDVPDSWRIAAISLGLAAAGLILSTVGLAGMGLANVVAYFRR